MRRLCSADTVPQFLVRVFVLGWYGPVSEPDMIKLNTPGPARHFRHRWGSDFYRRIQQLEDTFASRHRRLQDVVFLAKVLNWPEEALRILNERRQQSDTHRSTNHV